MSKISIDHEVPGGLIPGFRFPGRAKSVIAFFVTNLPGYTYNKTVKKLCLYIEYIKKIIIEGGLETVIEHESKKKILSVCLFVCTR